MAKKYKTNYEYQIICCLFGLTALVLVILIMTGVIKLPSNQGFKQTSTGRAQSYKNNTPLPDTNTCQSQQPMIFGVDGPKCPSNYQKNPLQPGGGCCPNGYSAYDAENCDPVNSYVGCCCKPLQNYCADDCCPCSDCYPKCTDLWANKKCSNNNDPCKSDQDCDNGKYKCENKITHLCVGTPEDRDVYGGKYFRWSWPDGGYGQCVKN